METKWQDYREMAKEIIIEQKLDLPLPRLQLTWVDVGRGNFYCDYSLLIPVDKYDCRNSDNNCGFIVSNISGTEVGRFGREPIEHDGSVDTPFRDSSHIRWDSKTLGDLPMYAVWKEVITELEQFED